MEANDHDTARRLVAESIEIELKTGDRPGLVFNFEVCAAAGGCGGSPRASRPSVRVRERAPRVDRHSPVRSRLARPGDAVAQLRAALGEEAFAEAWAEGRAMTLDESLAYALAEEGA